MKQGLEKYLERCLAHNKRNYTSEHILGVIIDDVVTFLALLFALWGRTQAKGEKRPVCAELG